MHDATTIFIFLMAMLSPKRIPWRSCYYFLHKRRERVSNSTRSFNYEVRELIHWALIKPPDANMRVRTGLPRIPVEIGVFCKPARTSIMIGRKHDPQPRLPHLG